MAEALALAANKRETTGKGPARQARLAGRVPAIVYGADADPLMVDLEEKALRKRLEQGGFFTSIIDLEVEGADKQRVLAREVQLHPVSDKPLHVDFLRVSARTRVAVEVPVSFLNEDDCPGLRRGGVLNIVRHSVELSCLANAIPDTIDVDLSGLDIHDSVHISAVNLPSGVTPTITDRDFTIATIAPPTVAPAESEEGEEGEAADSGGEQQAADEGDDSEAE